MASTAEPVNPVPSFTELVRAGNHHMDVPREVLYPYLQKLQAPLMSVDINVAFDPEVHLAFTLADVERTRRITMKALKRDSPRAISDIGVTDPFPLFTPAAVEIIRAEIFRTEVFEQYSRLANSSTTNLVMDWHLRGYTRQLCPFTHAAWHNPQVLAAVLAMAGVELRPVFDYEVGHVNVLLQLQEKYNADLEQIAAMEGSSEAFGPDPLDAIVNWHYDSWPFVCVLMLSDTTGMVGGETRLRMGCAPGEEPEVAMVPGPKQGYAAMLQGGQIEHIACKPLGSMERTTMVTLFVPKNPLMQDTLVLTTLQPEVLWGSRYTEYYPEWIEYRSKVIDARTDAIRKRSLEILGSPEFKKEEAIAALQDLEEYVRNSWKEMV